MRLKLLRSYIFQKLLCIFQDYEEGLSWEFFSFAKLADRRPNIFSELGRSDEVWLLHNK